MKLNTLNELPRLQVSSRKDDMIGKIIDEANSICSTILKQEAIKWIKEMDKYWESENSESGFNELFEGSIMDWIKHFFNIKPEDLEQ